MLNICQSAKNILDPTVAGRDEWRANLTLRFAHREGRTVLVEQRHSGPLIVQKTLYPEGPNICHAVVIHPPGGIAGGDNLLVRIEVETNGCTVITTPAATKWYKAAGRSSRQEVNVRLGANSTLDWLPQENLFFNAACVQSSFKLEIDPTASAIGWDMALFGRRASGEQWDTGAIRSLTEICNPNGTPLWVEQTLLKGSDPLLKSPHGMAGFTALGTLWAIGQGCTPAIATELNSQLPFEPALRAGATCLPNGVLLLRCLSTEVEPLRAVMIDCWVRLRPIILGFASHRLRLWAT